MPRNRPHPERSHRRKATTRNTTAAALRLRTLTHPVTHDHTRPASSRWFSQRTSGFIPRADAHNQHASTRIALVREHYTTSQLVQYPPKWCHTTEQQAFARTCTAYTTREGPMLHQFVRQCDTTVDRSTGNTARTLHPLRGTAPVTGRYTRYGALHPIRTGVMPTDRVHCTLRQEQTRNLKAHTTHGTGELARKVRQPPAHQAPPATTEHRPAHSPTWWQRGPTPAHVNPPGDNIGTPAQPPVNGGSCAQVG